GVVREWAAEGRATVPVRESWAAFGDLVAVLPAGPRVLSAGPSGLKVWELNPPVEGVSFGTAEVSDAAAYTYPLIPAPPGPARDGSPVAFSPDGRTVAVVQSFNRDGPFHLGRLVDAETGEPLSQLGGEGLTALPTFSPDGRAVAAGWRDGAVRV